MQGTSNECRFLDYDAHISDATAWATYTQEEVDEAGRVAIRQRQIRVLEREAAGWKIVFMGFQDMN